MMVLLGLKAHSKPDVLTNQTALSVRSTSTVNDCAIVFAAVRIMGPLASSRGQDGDDICR